MKEPFTWLTRCSPFDMSVVLGISRFGLEYGNFVLAVPVSGPCLSFIKYAMLKTLNLSLRRPLNMNTHLRSEYLRE